VKRFFFLFAGSLLLVTTLSIHMKADGGPKPNCNPQGQLCKP
jgi:hypothetical protein